MNWKRLGLELARVIGIGLVMGSVYQFMPTRTKANVPCSIPFTFVNGTVADATQVNANFNALVTCLGNAAAAGVNGDITQLTGLATPLTPAEGGTSSFMATAGTTGSANTMIIAATLPANFSFNTGYRVSFVSGTSNNNATTLNVNGLGAKNLYRKTTQFGAVAMVGGEIVGGNVYSAVYDGTEFVLDGPMDQVAEIRPWHGAAPLGWQAVDGQCYSTSNNLTVQIFAVIGTNYGNCGASTFKVPDVRGRNLTGLDNMGTATGAAGLLTGSSTGCGSAFNTVNATCANGNESHTLNTVEIPANPPIGGASFSGNSQTPGTNQTGIPTTATGSGVAAAGGSAFVPTSGSSIAIGQATITFTPTGSVTLGNMGSGGAHTIVNPNRGFYYIIKE